MSAHIAVGGGYYFVDNQWSVFGVSGGFRVISPVFVGFIFREYLIVGFAYQQLFGQIAHLLELLIDDIEAVIVFYVFDENGRRQFVEDGSHHLMCLLFHFNGIFQLYFFLNGFCYVVSDTYQKLVALGSAHIRFGGLQNDFFLTGNTYLFLKGIFSFSINGDFVVPPVFFCYVRSEYLVVVLSYDFVVRGVLQDTEVLVDHEIPEIVCDIFDEDDGIHPVYQELRQFIERLSDAQ